MSILSNPPPPPHVLPLKDEADQHVFLPPLQVQVKSTSPASLKSAMPIALSISSTLACSLSWTRRPVNNHHCRFRYPLGRFHYFLFICFFSFTFFFFFLFFFSRKVGVHPPPGTLKRELGELNIMLSIIRCMGVAFCHFFFFSFFGIDKRVPVSRFEGRATFCSIQCTCMGS